MCRIFGINKSTVYNWIKKLDEKIQSSNCKEEKATGEAQTVDVIEMGELFAYTKVKKQSLRNNVGDEKAAANRIHLQSKMSILTSANPHTFSARCKPFKSRCAFLWSRTINLASLNSDFRTLNLQ